MLATESAHQPMAMQYFDLGEVTSLTARLAQVMAQEIRLLQAMRISDIEPLQKEKNRLADALESYKKRVQKNPVLMQSFTEEELDELRDVTGIFEQIAQENYTQLMVAKQANEGVRAAITEVLKESRHRCQYDRKGKAEEDGDVLPPLSLNEKI